MQSIAALIDHLPSPRAEARALMWHAHETIVEAPATHQRHARRVASILADLHSDPNVIAAGLLQDVLTLDVMTPTKLRTEFG
jgi:(p)ppGpp synthase/HD superfamily hydrolase